MEWNWTKENSSERCRVGRGNSAAGVLLSPCKTVAIAGIPRRMVWSGVGQSGR